MACHNSTIPQEGSYSNHIMQGFCTLKSFLFQTKTLCIPCCDSIVQTIDISAGLVLSFAKLDALLRSRFLFMLKIGKRFIKLFI